jgi:hypothetical protein
MSFQTTGITVAAIAILIGSVIINLNKPKINAKLKLCDIFQFEKVHWIFSLLHKKSIVDSG